MRNQQVLIFFLGLILAIFNACLGIIQKQVEFSYSFSAPFFSSLTFYFFQMILIVLPSSHKHWKQAFYPLLNGLVDCSGNICIVYAFSLTSIVSVSLFQTLAIPSALIFSLCIIRRKFTPLHVISVVLAMAFSAAFAGTDYSGTKLLGSILGILGAFLFGLSSVLMERFSGKMSNSEYMSKMGLSGAILSGVLSASLERDFYTQNNAPGLALLLVYGIVAAVYIFLGLYVISKSSAVFFMMCSVLVPVFTFPVDVLHFKTEFVWWQILLGIGLILSVFMYVLAGWLQERRERKEQEREMGKGVVNVEEVEEGVVGSIMQ